MHGLASTSIAEDVVARLMNEGVIGMTAASKLIGTFRDGKDTCSTTIARWCQKGIRLANGRLLKLESFRLNGRLCTSKAAIIRFIQAQNCTSDVVQAKESIESPTQRKSIASAASRELDAVLGVK